MWSLTLSAALAASAREEVARALQVNPSSNAVVSCAPLGAVLTLASQVPLPAAMVKELSEDQRALVSLFGAERAQSSGLDPMGALVIAMARKAEGGQPVLQLPFRGTREQAEALLRTLYEEVDPAGDVWRVRRKGKAALATLGEAGLIVQPIRVNAVAATAPASPRILDGLPDNPGCVVWVDATDGAMMPELPGGGKAGSEALGKVRMAAFLPIGGGAPLVIHIEGKDGNAPLPLAAGRAGWESPRSAERPTMVLTLSVGLEEVLDILSRTPGFPASELDQMRGSFTIGAGVTIATFGNPREKNVVMRLPITMPDGAPIPPKKLARGVVKLSDGVLKPAGKTGFKGMIKDQELFGLATPGAVFVGTTEPGVAAAAAGLGEPWLDSDMLAYSAKWPMAVQSVESGAMPLSMRLGMRTVEGVWEVAGEVSPLPPEMGAMLSGMLGAVAVPSLVGMQKEAKRAELLSNVEGIRTAELAYDAAYDSFLAMPVAPIPYAALDAQLVPWVGGSEWKSLGWAPKGELRGNYWVEVSADGKDFTVHGQMDADDDGVPAEVTATRDGEAALVTPIGAF